LASISTPQDDKILWQEFKLGDELAFSTLYQRNVRILYSYGKKLLPSDGNVEDLVQDLFIELWQSKSRLADVDSPKFYLFRALRHKIHKSMHSHFNSSQSWEFTDETDLPIALPTEFDIIEAESSLQQKNELESWLKTLPARQKEVLTLRYYQNFSYTEIAEILCIHEQSVRNLAQRAVLKLRRISIPSTLVAMMLLF
jgi:RNA polymerase sigma factor (sigma-70 family)